MNAEFVDTNVHVYCFDRASGRKQEIAHALIGHLFSKHAGATSIQVFCEFFTVATRKIKHPLSAAQAESVIRNLSRWTVHEPTVDNVMRAIARASRRRISFWDAMVIESAIASGCDVLWSEDLSDGALYDGVRVRNPFA